jgi:hypothetical protein
MKCLIKTISAFLLFLPTITMAGWEVAKPETAIPNEPFFQADYTKPIKSAPMAPAPQPPTPIKVLSEAPTPLHNGKLTELANNTRATSPHNGGAVFANKLPTTGKPAEVYAISVSGSLKENIERIMHRYHWKVVWKAPHDYNFDGRVTGSSLPNVMEKLLKPFPLQAVLYMSNRTMTVVPRKS